MFLTTEDMNIIFLAKFSAVMYIKLCRLKLLSTGAACFLDQSRAESEGALFISICMYRIMHQ